MILKNISSIILVIFVIGTLSAVLAQSQEPVERVEARERRQKSNDEGQKIIDVESKNSALIKAIHSRICKVKTESEFAQIIDEMGMSQNKTFVPYLKARLMMYDSRGRSSIEVALYKLGESQYFDSTLAELNSPDLNIQNNAIWKLARFQSKEAYRKLFELLDDETVRDPIDHGDYLVQSFSRLAMENLASTVSAPPRDRFNKIAWKKWFEGHPEEGLNENTSKMPASPKGTENIAKGKAEGRNPGDDAHTDPDPEGAEQTNAVIACIL